MQLMSSLNSLESGSHPSSTETALVLVTNTAAAKSLQLCPTLCNPRDGSPPGSAIPGIFQARVVEWGTIALSIPGGTVVKNLPANTGDVGLISVSGRSPREGNDNPLQCSCLENPRDGGA